MKSLLKVSLGVLFLTTTGIAMADDYGHPDDHARVVVVAPVRHHHRHYYHPHPHPHAAVILNVGGH